MSGQPPNMVQDRKYPRTPGTSIVTPIPCLGMVEALAQVLNSLLRSVEEEYPKPRATYQIRVTRIGWSQQTASLYRDPRETITPWVRRHLSSKRA